MRPLRLLLSLICISLTACTSPRTASTDSPAPLAASTPKPTDLPTLRSLASLPTATPADQITLGERLMNGDGSGANIDEAGAAAWFSKAADRNDPLGQTRLADLLITGRGVIIDQARALTLYRQAAEAGLPEAQFSLGTALSEGRGTPNHAKDTKEAVRWWTTAANSGYAPAQFQMAICRQRGLDGSPPDNSAAFAWFQRAANQGHVASQANVGRAYLKAEGVPKDAAKAYMWSWLAIENGAPLAKRTTDAAAKELSETQIAEAKRIAADFKPHEEHPTPSR